MTSRKLYGHPFTDRHLRRLKAKKKKSFFEEMNERFHQLINKNMTSRSHPVDLESKNEENINDFNNLESNTTKTHRSMVILNSIEYQNSFLQPLEIPESDVLKSNIEKIENEHNQILIQEPINFEQHEGQEIEFNNQDFDHLLMYLQIENDFDISESDDMDDEEQSKNSKSTKNEIVSLEENHSQFIMQIKQWSINYVHTIPHCAINDLLKILKNNTDCPFPSDSRTLLRTPRKTEIHSMHKGHYCHYGLQNAILEFLKEMITKNINPDCLEILVNVDGAPLATSSEKGLWIISCSETILKKVAVIGIYHGEEKPEDSNELLKIFEEEMSNLINNGINYEEKHYQIKFHALVCDAPAKAYVLKVKYHTGYWSCTKCNIKGEWLRKICFPGECGILRTDVGFKQNQYLDDGWNDGYQQGYSVFTQIPNFGMVSNVVLDYMHLICLGVMVKLIELWLSGPVLTRLSDQERKIISSRLLHLRNYMPSDFSRKPRKFENVRRLWKAHELRQFLLYSGPVVLRSILSNDAYINFLYLHVSVSILVNPLMCKSLPYLEFCQKLLSHFVKGFTILYGRENTTFNVHNLLHVVEDVKNYGSLDNFSSFRFENHIRKIKQLVRKGDKPLQQIACRLAEIKPVKELMIPENDLDADVLKKKHIEGPILPFDQDFEQFRIFQKGSLYLNCTDSKNNSVLLNDGVNVECHNFIKKNNTAFILGKPYVFADNLYHEPIDSATLNIKIVKISTENLQLYSCDTIVAKLCRIPYKQLFVLFPLTHTLLSAHN